jgi:hypothetical protein
MAYVKAILDILAGSAGVASFPSSAAPANAISLAEVLREVFDQSGKAANKAAEAITNGQTLFTIAGGPIIIDELVSLCVTTNDATASTLQYRSDPTVGTATVFSGASASLANVNAGATVRLQPTALSTAPVVAAHTAGGVQLGSDDPNKITIQAGTIVAVVGVGSTTGTWSHHLRYRPLSRGVTVT